MITSATPRPFGSTMTTSRSTTMNRKSRTFETRSSTGSGKGYSSTRSGTSAPSANRTGDIGPIPLTVDAGQDQSAFFSREFERNLLTRGSRTAVIVDNRDNHVGRRVDDTNPVINYEVPVVPELRRKPDHRHRDRI